MTIWRKQQQALFHRDTTGDDVVAQYFINGTRVYGTFPDAYAYSKFILTDPDGDTSNELMYDACHSHFDLDSKLTLEELGFSSVLEFTDKFTDFLHNCFKQHLGEDIPRRNFLWSTSTRPSKTSFHITVLSDHKFWTKIQKNDDLKAFAKLVESDSFNHKGFYYLVDTNDEISMHSLVDVSIYSKNRCLRSLGARKLESDVKFQPLENGVVVPTTERLIRKYMVSLPKSECQGRTPYTLETKLVKQKTSKVNRSLLETYAAEYGCKVVSVSGSLVKLRNAAKCRVCPIGHEENYSDNAFFILKDSCLFLGCFDANCTGKLHKVHEFSTRYNFYEDYRAILATPVKERTRSMIAEYLKSTCCFVDQPEKNFFVTSTKRPVTCFKNLESKHMVCSPSLFGKNADISVEIGDDKVRFSEVLHSLLLERKIKTFTSASWRPFIQKLPVIMPKTKLNTFGGFALDNPTLRTAVDFTKTKLFDLLQRLVNYDKDCFAYLMQYLALRLQKVSFKPSTALCFVNSCQGVGKGTFVEFLKRVWACGRTTVVSYNKLSQFTSVFNSELAHCVWCVLEEVNCKNKGSLREFSGLLKDMCSTNTLLLERKGENRTNCDFFGTLIIFSNELRCLNVSKGDRRMALFSSNSEMANSKEYFTEIYKELDSVAVLRSAFLFLCSIDITNFDFRKFPKTNLRKQVQNCSDNIEHKFYKQLFKEIYVGSSEFTFCEKQLFNHWKEFSEEYGLVYRRDRGWVASTFEAAFNIQKQDTDFYSITFAEIQKTMCKIYPNDIFWKAKNKLCHPSSKTTDIAEP